MAGARQVKEGGVIIAQEKQFEKKVKEFLGDCGCWVLKTWSNGTQRKGIPDLLVCCNGYLLGVELKAPNGRPSELQKWNIKKIREAGGIAIVLYPKQFEEFKNLIYDIKSIVCSDRVDDIVYTQYFFGTK